MDDMIVKTSAERDPVTVLEKIFTQMRRYNLRLNPAKCTFCVEASKFLRFMLTHRGIEVNPEKCRAVVEMQSPRSIKEVQQLTEKIAALTRFLPKSAQKALPLFRILKGVGEFKWTEECNEAFKELKRNLATPPVLSKAKPGENLYLYLAVAEEAISAALVREEGRHQYPIYFISKVL